MRVEVRPIEREKWHGKKGKESFSRPNKLSALVDPDTMRYATGLTEKEAEEYGKKLDQDLSAHFVQGKEHPFWDSTAAVVKLDNKTFFLNTENPIEFVKSRMLRASKYVANSMKEYNEGKWPDATHVIYDESEELEVKASKVALRDEAIIEKSKLSKARKIQIVLILDGKNLKNQSDNYIDVALSELIDKDPGEVLRYIKQNKTQVADHALVLEALQKNVLHKSGHKIMYLDSVVGQDVIDVVQYLNLDENQDFKLRITKAINE